MNRLSRENSPYLRHAAAQPIDWYPWGEEAFDIARSKDKPVFLSSGAIWCHWCHVMADESFVDLEVAKIFKEHFIAVKLDRDEKPDIDRRYQRAAAAAGVGGGWPLSVFLTPEKKPFFVGTYFPPEDGYGRPSFKRVLRTVAHHYRTRRDEIELQSDRLFSAMAFEGNQSNATTIPGPDALDEAAGLMLSHFDSEHGGFGSAPKFPMAGAIDFLLQRYALTGNGVIGNAVRKTLDAMARGGFHDQLGGGFHRYSVDDSWSIPHFEKMADDNAWLLRNYLDGYSLLGEEHHRQVALGIVKFVRDVLSDPRGGFYASQDADVTASDEGGYFTWTEDEFRDILAPVEYEVLSLHLLSDKGSMHHNPSKKTLLMNMSDADIARRLNLDRDVVVEAINSGKTKLINLRRRREEPFVDRTIYTSLNGGLITAFLKAFRVLRDEDTRDFALLSLDRVIRERLIDGKLHHVEGVEALLDDYAALIDALIEAYEVTRDRRHLDLANRLADQTIEKFWDGERGGFFDSEHDVLGTRLRTIEDVPHPSANGVTFLVLLKLSAILEKPELRALVEKGIISFADEARKMGPHAGCFFAALDAYHNMIRLEFEGPPPEALLNEAWEHTKPVSAHLYRPGPGRVIPCSWTACFEPLESPEEFQGFLKTMSKRAPVETQDSPK
jgi:uncharacterized protein